MKVFQKVHINTIHQKGMNYFINKNFFLLLNNLEEHKDKYQSLMLSLLNTELLIY